MANQIVKVGDVDYEFPADMDDTAIQAAIQKDLHPEPPGPSLMDRMKAGAKRGLEVAERLPDNIRKSVAAQAGEMVGGVRQKYADNQSQSLARNADIMRRHEAAGGKRAPLAPSADEVEQQAFQQDLKSGSGARQASEQAIKGEDAIPQDAGFIERMAQQGIASAAVSAPAMLLAGPVGGAALLSVGAGGQRYADLTRKGFSRADASQSAAMLGSLEGLTEFLPGATLVKNVPGFWKHLGEFLITELPGENITAIAQAIDDQRLGLRDDITKESYLRILGETIAETSAATAFGSGAQIGAAQLLQRTMKNLRGPAAEQPDLNVNFTMPPPVTAPAGVGSQPAPQQAQAPAPAPPAQVGADPAQRYSATTGQRFNAEARVMPQPDPQQLDEPAAPIVVDGQGTARVPDSAQASDMRTAQAEQATLGNTSVERFDAAALDGIDRSMLESARSRQATPETTSKLVEAGLAGADGALLPAGRRELKRQRVEEIKAKAAEVPEAPIAAISSADGWTVTVDGEPVITTETEAAAHDIVRAAKTEAQPATVLGQSTSHPAQPTHGQASAGNYTKPQVRWNDMTFRVENVKGSTRGGTDSGGKPWTRKLTSDYGYISKSVAKDGDAVDVYMGETPDSDMVYVVDQLTPDGRNYDEAKVIAAAPNQKAAEKLYLSNYPSGWKGMGAITPMRVEDFKKWVYTDAAKKPVAWAGNSSKPAKPLTPAAPVKAATGTQQTGKVGMMLAAGDTATTSSGRVTTAFPAVDVSTNGKTINTVKRADRWLMQNALDEARARGDDFNARQFEANLDKPQQADKDSAEEYLFGEQPDVPRSELKSLGSTAPEHLGNKGKPLNREEKFTPTAKGGSRVAIDEKSGQVIPLQMSESDFNEIVDEWAALFEDPADRVVTANRPEAKAMLTPAQAKARIAEWKKHAAAQQKTHGPTNADKTIISLFDYTGAWSQPYVDAGYNVIRMDIQNGYDINDLSAEYFTENWDLGDVYGILAACPCTDFSSSGARHFDAKDKDGRTEASKELVFKTMQTIEFFRPAFWALENPVGRIESLTGLPKARMTFDPNHFGYPYTKKTMLWGRFNAEMELAPVEPTEGSKMHMKFGGKSLATKNARSETPEGFAYSFFKANNFVDTPPLQRTVTKYPEAAGAIEAASAAGVEQAEIEQILYDTYENGEPEAARAALKKATQKLGKTTDKAAPTAKSKKKPTVIERMKKAKPEPVATYLPGVQEHEEQLRAIANEAGWSEIGGKMIRATEDRNDPDYSKVVSRTKWTARNQIWHDAQRSVPKGVKGKGIATALAGNSEGSATRVAVRKAINGEKLSAAETRHIKALTDGIEFQQLEEKRLLHEDLQAQAERDIQDEIDRLEARVKQMEDGDIPFPDLAAPGTRSAQDMDEVPFMRRMGKDSPVPLFSRKTAGSGDLFGGGPLPVIPKQVAPAPRPQTADLFGDPVAIRNEIARLKAELERRRGGGIAQTMETGNRFDLFSQARQQEEIPIAPQPTKDKTDVQRTVEPIEPDRSQRPDEKPVGDKPVQPVGGAEAGGAGEPGKATGGNRGEPASGNRVPDVRTTAGGERGNQPVHNQRGLFGDPGSSAGSDVDRGSTADSGARPAAEQLRADEVSDAVEQSRPDVTREQKRRLQAAAEPIEVVNADLANVAATLPFLLPQQHEDVQTAESRFRQPNGYGMLFTNGTGTGKTFVALGAIKRQLKRGKRNQLIAVPSQKIADDWILAGAELGLTIKKLADTTDNAGGGIAITTHANMGDNPTLVDIPWDMVTIDEAHGLMQGSASEPTATLYALRALTYHPNSAYDRASMLHRDLYGEIEKLRSETKGKKNPDQSKMIRLETLEARFRPLVEEQKRIVASKKGFDRPRSLFMTATPFAYEKNVQWAEGYLFEYPPEDTSGRYNAAGGYNSFMIQHFGYRMRVGKLTEPDANVDRDLMQRNFNTWLRKQGVLSARMLDVDKDYDRKFVYVESKVGAIIDEGLNWLRAPEQRRFWPIYDAISKRFDYIERSRLLQGLKARESIDYIKKQHALGRKVIVFYDFNEGGSLNVFDIDERGFAESQSSVEYVGDKQVEHNLRELVREFRQLRPDLVTLDTQAANPLITLGNAFPQMRQYNGRISTRNRNINVREFNDDEMPQSNLIMAQKAANAGWSAHDTTGKSQRVLINLGLPTAPVQSIQIEGRIYRVGQASDAIFRYFNTGTTWERIAFATTIARRAGTAENLAMGEQARGLKDAFITAFENADAEEPAIGDGKGGKEADRSIVMALSDFDKAKGLYWATQKKTSRTKSAEGEDYYATPEPLGQKMVEWLGLNPGETSMEPSAGHGAIARWLPENSPRLLVEPSMELASRLGLVTDGKIVVQRFEDLNIINKAHGIVMNPPFGSAGRTAVDHIIKAEKHLHDGGRLVALIPEGSATTKFDKWYEEQEGMYLVRQISLPTVTFERAGTKVKTRVVILDKVSKKALKAGAQIANYGSQLDISDATDIKEFFSRIENLSTPDRVKFPAVMQAEIAATLDPKTAPKPERPEPSASVYTTWTAAEDEQLLRLLGERKTTSQIMEATGKTKEDVMVRIILLGKEGRTVPGDGERPTAAPATKTGLMSPAQFTHTKTGAPQYVAVVNEYLGDRYKAVSALAKEMGGYYSSYKSDGAIAGFLFKTEAARDQFIGKMNGEQPKMLRNRTPITGLHESEVRSQLNDTLRGFANRPALAVVQDFNDLPKARLARIAARGGKRGDVKAFFDPENGTMYFIANEFSTAEQVTEALLHEYVIHFGLSMLPDQAKHQILDGIAKDNAEAIEAYGYQEFGDQWDRNNVGQRRLAAEEALAYAGQRYLAGEKISDKLKRWVDYLIAQIRDMLRYVGGLGPKFDTVFMKRLLQDLQTHLKSGEARGMVDAANEEVFAPVDQPYLQRDTPVYYSALERGVLAAKRDKGTAAEWLNTLRNLPGIKQEEVDWVGLEPYLTSLGRSVTKNEVLDFVRANQIKVEETVKGGESESLARAEQSQLVVELSALGYTWHSDEVGDGDPFLIKDRENVTYWPPNRSNDQWTAYDKLGRRIPDSDLPEKIQQMSARLLEIEQDLQDIEFENNGNDEETRYSKYKLPGGENYRELLLTLPITTKTHQVFDTKSGKVVASFDTSEEAAADAVRRGPSFDSDTKYSHKNPEVYRSSHWDEPNILAHVRFDERTDADGKRTLHVAEIQSDWHQTGRKKGYQGGSGRLTVEDVVAKRVPHATDPRHLGYWDVTNARTGELVRRVMGALENERQAIDLALTIVQGKGVPDAPFKTTWPELAFKRVLRYAAEGNFDRITWDTGDTSNARYNLATHIIEMAYAQAADGRWSVQYKERGRSELRRTVVEDKELEDTVGAAVAIQMRAGEGVKWERGGMRDLKLDESIEIGGDGMRGFYDKILPATVSKLTKKWGGKVSRSKVNSVPMYQVRGEDGETASFATEEEAEAHADDVNGETTVDHEGGAAVHALDITPQMREAALAGLPLFQRRHAYAVHASGGGPRNQLSLFSARDPSLAHIETRPGTTKEQVELGNAAVRSLRAYRDRGAAITVSALNLPSEFVNRGHVRLVGQTVRSGIDLGQLAHVYRDPRFETLRVFVMREQQVIHQLGMTSRLPGSVQFSINRLPGRESFAALAKQIKDLGADGYYLLHNHPSGRPQPSSADYSFTTLMAANIPGFRGHVVIDHTEFAVFDERGMTDFSPMPAGGYDGSKPTIASPLLDRPISSPAAVAAMARMVQHNQQEHTTIIGTDVRAMSSVVVSYPNELLRQGTASLARMRRLMTATGSIRLFAVTSDMTAIHDLLQNGIITDAAEPMGAIQKSVGYSEYRMSRGEGGGRDMVKSYQVFEADESAQPETDDIRFQRTAQGMTGAIPRNRPPMQVRGYKAMAQAAIDKFNDAVGWRWSPLGKMPQQDQYLKLRYLTLGKLDEVKTITRAIFDALKVATAEDSEAVYEYLTTFGSSSAGIVDHKIRMKAEEVKMLIDEQGQALVDAGLLPEEVYEKFAGEYLPRLYLKHIMGDGVFKAMGSGMKTTDQGYLKKRKDIDEEVRKVILGQIYDPAFLASFGISRTMRDLAMIDFMEQVSDNRAWVPPKSVMQWGGRNVSPYWARSEAARLRKQADFIAKGGAGQETADSARQAADTLDARADRAMEAMGESDLSDFKQIPDTVRYGALRGLWVRKEIYEDMVAATTFIDPGSFEGMMQRTLGKATRWWKTSKVGLNVPSHWRNMMGNTIQLQLSGVPLWRMPDLFAKAISSLLEDDQYYQIAKKYGLRQASFANTELGRVRDEFLTMASSGAGTMDRMMAALGKVGNALGDVYQFEESLFKLAKLRYEMESNNLPEDEAMLEAHKWLFDYSLVPRTIRYLRNAPAGTPFITYTYKALPRIAEALVKTPWRFLPYIAVYYALRELIEAAWDVDDDDLEKLRAAMPSWMANKSSMMLLPVKDQYGRWQAVDMGYIVPWGMPFDVTKQLAEGEIQQAADSTGFMGAPIAEAIAVWLTGIDPFTKKPVINKALTTREQIAQGRNYMLDMALPGWLSPNGWAGKVYDWKNDVPNKRTGEPKLGGGQLISALLGITIYPVDAEETRRTNTYFLSREVSDAQRQLGAIQRDKSLTNPETKKARLDAQKAYVKQKQEAMREYAKDSRFPQRLNEDKPAGEVINTAPDVPQRLLDRVLGIFEGSQGLPDAANRAREAGYPALAGLLEGMPDTPREKIAAALRESAA